MSFKSFFTDVTDALARWTPSFYERPPTGDTIALDGYASLPFWQQFWMALSRTSPSFATRQERPATAAPNLVEDVQGHDPRPEEGRALVGAGWSYSPAPSQRPLEELFVGRTRELDKLDRLLSQDKQSVVQLLGQAGAGKTTLLTLLSKRLGESTTRPSDRRIVHVSGSSPTVMLLEAWNELEKAADRRSLLLIDDADSLEQSALEPLRALLHSQRKVSVLLTSRRGVHLPTERGHTVVLGSFSRTEQGEYLRRRLAQHADLKIAAKLWEATEGSPLLTELACQAIAEQSFTWERLFSALKGFEHTWRIGDDAPAGGRSKPAWVEAGTVNARLADQFTRDTASVRSLAPHEFEQLVEDMLAEQGYEVELTPISGTDVLDLFVARKKAVGEFLYTVQIRRSVSPDRLGMHIVRSLRGLLELDRSRAYVALKTFFPRAGRLHAKDSQTVDIDPRDYIEFHSWLQEYVARGRRVPEGSPNDTRS